MQSFSMIRWLQLSVACALLTATGCAKVELYSQLDEQQANEMMAVLLAEDIQCNKLAGEETTWKVEVSQADFSKAVNRLRQKGYPKTTYTGMGDVFKKSGLVSSPTEERIRFMHALSQELSQTISQIDGVVSARVHIVLPNNNPFGDTIQPSSASVFVKHQPNANLSVQIPEITRLVVGSIEGLEYDAVSTVLFAADEIEPLTVTDSAEALPAMVNFLGLQVPPETRDRLSWFMSIAGLGAVVLLGTGGCFWFLRNSQRRTDSRAASGANLVNRANTNGPSANRSSAKPMTA